MEAGNGVITRMRCLLLCLMALALPLTAAEEAAVKPTIAIYDLEGPITEAGASDDSFLALTMNPSRPLTLFDLSRSLEKALTDPELKAVVLDVDGASLDLSQLQEIRRQLRALREAGKDVWLYTEHLSNGTALLGSAANHFTLMPEANCEFHGIYAESLYFKGMLDKLGVRADVIHIGDFKSFGETFYRTGPSDYALKQEEALIDSIFNQVVAQVAEGRGLSQEAVKSLIDDGTLNAGRAVEAKLADSLMYRTDLVKKLKETYGEDADFDREYQLPDLDGPQITGMMDFFKLMFSDSNNRKSRKDFIAVVALDGDITEESIVPVRSEILKLAKDDKAKALVLRVNSPGGSAMASEILWEATDEWNATKKPFVVSMGGVAASGGYYVAAAAQRIFAEEGTITGSIGVVGMKFVLGEAMEKIGITTHSTQRGKNAGIMNVTEGFSEEETKLVRDSMTEIYSTFKKRINDGRGKVLKGDLDSLAGGRVYSGKDALEVGLIDEIGGLHEAIAYAAREAKLVEPEARLVPQPKSGLEGLFAPPEKDDDEIIRASVKDRGAMRLGGLVNSSGFLEALPASSRSSVKRLISRIEAFQNCRVLLLAPDLEVR